MESFFASLKKELVHGEDYHSRAEARGSIFEYIEVFYNPREAPLVAGLPQPRRSSSNRNNR